MRTVKKSIQNSNRCLECGRVIGETPYRFGGGLACEQCVLGYYKGQGYSKSAIAFELKCRARDAVQWQQVHERIQKRQCRRDDEESFL